MPAARHPTPDKFCQQTKRKNTITRVIIIIIFFCNFFSSSSFLRERDKRRRERGDSLDGSRMTLHERGGRISAGSKSETNPSASRRPSNRAS